MSEVEDLNVDSLLEDYQNQIKEIRRRIKEVRRQTEDTKKFVSEKRADLKASLERIDQESWEQKQAANEHEIEIARVKGEMLGRKFGIAYMQGFTVGFQAEVSELLPEFFASFNEKLAEKLSSLDG